MNKNESIDLVPPPCTCPYFGDKPNHSALKPAEVKIITTSRSFRSTSSSLHDPTTQSLSDSTSMSMTTTTTTSTSPSKRSLQLLPVPPTPPVRKHSYSKSNSVVTWDTKRSQRRGSSFGGVKTSLQVTYTSWESVSIRKLSTKSSFEFHLQTFDQNFTNFHSKIFSNYKNIAQNLLLYRSRLATFKWEISLKAQKFRSVTQVLQVCNRSQKLLRWLFTTIDVRQFYDR